MTKGKPLTLEKYHSFFLDPWATNISIDQLNEVPPLNFSLSDLVHAWLHQAPPWEKAPRVRPRRAPPAVQAYPWLRARRRVQGGAGGRAPEKGERDRQGGAGARAVVAAAAAATSSSTAAVDAVSHSASAIFAASSASGTVPASAYVGADPRVTSLLGHAHGAAASFAAVLGLAAAYTARASVLPPLPPHVLPWRCPPTPAPAAHPLIHHMQRSPPPHVLLLPRPPPHLPWQRPPPALPQTPPPPPVPPHHLPPHFHGPHRPPPLLQTPPPPPMQTPPPPMPQHHPPPHFHGQHRLPPLLQTPPPPMLVHRPPPYFQGQQPHPTLHQTPQPPGYMGVLGRPVCPVL
ncbi:hypothetical protein HU200_023022 [Digitaria exilis]|uniref:Uncharacterized protein n=1 Tax=Digitaria exilis TaxID=1010633 RepID=A0A835EX44_9POAL|nr:hypothetical protein HU200_023022 [Digitaria exilis]